MIKFLRLPTVYLSNDYEEYPESMREEMMKKDKGTPGFIWVNINQISAFNKSNSGRVTLRIGSDSWEITMKFEDFKSLLLNEGNCEFIKESNQNG